MGAVTRVAVVALVAGTGVAPLAGQGGWLPPEPPCVLPPGHAKVNAALAASQQAAERAPEQREPLLRRAQQSLLEAIVRDRQEENPAAWYYLGRADADLGDVAGADTAFARVLVLAPVCVREVAVRRRELASTVIDGGLTAWQEGRQDSAAALFRLAARLDPTNPRPLTAIAGLFAARGGDDSALAYYGRAAAAGRDTAFARERRDALANAWRLLVRRVQGHPAAQEIPRLRLRLDSAERALARDSAVLAKLLASAQSRRARGARLAPADQRLFTRDSTARAEGVAQARERRAAALRQLAADSGTLAAAFAPAIEALRAFLAEYPDALDAATALATLYAQSGREGDAAAVFDSVAAHAPRAPGALPAELFATGQRLVGQGYARAGARALELGLARNPYARDALYALALAQYQRHDSAALLPTAQRLLALDPLNRAALKLVAAGWDFRARRDSALAYVARADSGLAVEITVSVFSADSNGAALTALASNLRPMPSRAFRLAVEFLDTRGQVVATASADVPPLPPRQARELEFKVSGAGIAGWRYRAL
jgi:hypothetical protein